jgi:hypothetical protein
MFLTLPRALCPSCQTELVDVTCKACGWDTKEGIHRCTRCNSAITFDPGLGFGGIFPLLGGVSSGVVVFFGGLLGALAIAAGLAAFGAFVSGLTLGFECALCRENVPRSMLSAGERKLVRGKRGLFLGGSVVLAIVCTILSMVWASMQKKSLSETVENFVKGDNKNAAPPGASGSATLNVDNISRDDWKVWVDDKEIGTVKAGGVFVHELPSGKHNVRAGSVGQAEITFNASRTTVFNPGGRSTYLRLSANYSTAPFAEGSGSEETLTGQELVEVDFGLTAELPTTVLVWTNMFGQGSAMKSKLYRKTPDSITFEDAIALFSAPEHVYVPGSRNTPRVLDALKPFDDPRAKEILFSLVEKPGLVDDAFKAMAEANVEVSDEQLSKWLIAKRYCLMC